jgi:hypothetical protein
MKCVDIEFANKMFHRMISLKDIDVKVATMNLAGAIMATNILKEDDEYIVEDEKEEGD